MDLDLLDQMQLDIFEDSRDVMLKNDVAHALEQRDALGARVACERLAREYPADDTLPALQALAESIEAGGLGQPQPIGDHEALRAARQMMDLTICPAAQRIFDPPGAIRWLRASWQDLARRAGALPFDAKRPQDHAAALWLRAGAWEEVAQSVASIESWRRIPTPLAWMAEARLHLLGLRATWPLLAELGWLSPTLLEGLARRSPDPLLPQLMRSFEANFNANVDAIPDGNGEIADLSWFAAWALTDRPALREQLALAQASQHSAPEQAMRLMVELLGLERQGRHADIVARRKELRDLQPSLYAAYMKTR
ncbi:hypothetical protein QTI66_30100 [Variovorax sp. J22R133]|uniref:hypothetical protein n=1 Tax=Variovorax brevis TaxID=3053503 RepID=UPI002574B6D8|nr:hypothetical protein [Variovorax sp. J22R133]MDM0116403.1 hypothetical protein [Variovorax sp. J22R133]